MTHEEIMNNKLFNRYTTSIIKIGDWNDSDQYINGDDNDLCYSFHHINTFYEVYDWKKHNVFVRWFR